MVSIGSGRNKCNALDHNVGQAPSAGESGRMNAHQGVPCLQPLMEVKTLVGGHINSPSQSRGRFHEGKTERPKPSSRKAIPGSLRSEGRTVDEHPTGGHWYQPARKQVDTVLAPKSINYWIAKMTPVANRLIFDFFNYKTLANSNLFVRNQRIMAKLDLKCKINKLFENKCQDDRPHPPLRH